MNNKGVLGIIFLFLILISAISFVSAEDHSYSIEHAWIDLTVGSNGQLHKNNGLLSNCDSPDLTGPALPAAP